MFLLRGRRARFVAAAACLASIGCSHKPQVSDLTSEFVYTTLSFSPSTATAVGLHRYKDQRFDAELDDMGPAAEDRQIHFYEDFNQRLQQIDPASLNPQDRADFSNLQDRTGLALFDLTVARTSVHNPLRYVEALARGIYIPSILEYAPKAERFHHIAWRLRQVPLLLDQATTNIVSAPAVWAKAAMEVNGGMIDLVNEDLRAAAPPEVRKDYEDAAGIALPAMRKFQDYLTNNLQYLDNFDWRLGQDAYAKKYHYALESGGTPQDVLVNVEQEFANVRAGMLKIAVPLHQAMFPAHKDHRELAGLEQQQRILGEVLGKLAERHSTPDSLMEDAERDLEESRQFVRQNRLFNLTGGENIQMLPTPAFLRNIETVSAFQPSPPLEPRLSAFYWIAPIPMDMPKEKAESKLRELNFYRLKLLMLGTAIPGSYSQTEAANSVEPPARRLLRTVFGSRGYFQGWREFAARVTIDAGFSGRSPEIALMFAKEQLRIIADAAIDVRLHTLHMTDQEALTLLENYAFQEPEEAEAKLRLAKLTSCELAGGFIGAANWAKAIEEYHSWSGGSLADFGSRALSLGAVPMSSLGKLLKQPVSASK